ncbi:MAG: hypothetical protein GF333_02490 [Candidatus Omnitrophica bacterium]|nr:hypothetical protein [Candidatus Omnitrophota bacterium]
MRLPFFFHVMKFGLALSGGGARGFFHIGVLKSLARFGIRPDAVAGTSIGAVIGGMYALDPDPFRLEQKIFRIFRKHRKGIGVLKNYSASSSVEEKKIFLEKSYEFVKDLFLWNLHIIKPYLVDPAPFIRIMRDLFGSARFAHCRIPFFCTGVDLRTGSAVVLDQGSVARSVTASCAFPGFFPPIEIDQQELVDGGVLLPLPAQVLKERGYWVVGVNADNKEEFAQQKKNAVEILFLTEKIRHREILAKNLESADFLISAELENVLWVDFDRAPDLVAIGEEVGDEYGRRLMRTFRKERIKRFFTFRR